MKPLLLFLLNRLREGTTWIGVFVSTLSFLPPAIEEPLTKVVVGILSIITFFVKEGQTGDSPESRAKNATPRK